MKSTPSLSLAFLIAVMTGAVVTPIAASLSTLVVHAVTPKDPVGAYVRDLDDLIAGLLLGLLAGTVACVYVGSRMLRPTLRSSHRRDAVGVLVLAALVAALIGTLIAGFAAGCVLAGNSPGSDAADSATMDRRPTRPLEPTGRPSGGSAVTHDRRTSRSPFRLPGGDP